MAEVVIVETTCATRDEARTIARACVAARLAACAHMDEIESLYRWQEAVQETTEVRLRLKTVAPALPALQALVEQHHGYEEPAFLVLPVTAGTESYLDWIEQNASR